MTPAEWAAFVAAILSCCALIVGGLRYIIRHEVPGILEASNIVSRIVHFGCGSHVGRVAQRVTIHGGNLVKAVTLAVTGQSHFLKLVLAGVAANLLLEKLGTLFGKGLEEVHQLAVVGIAAGNVIGGCPRKDGFNTSVKLTTVKPSGTLSLLPGVTPGCHPAYSRFMIRRIRIASNHSLVNVCRDSGYPVEYQRNFDGSEDHSTMVVSFPFRHPDHAVLAKDMTALQQLETVKWLQETWSDNSVSCTVYYRKEELPEIRKYLKKHYKNNHKSLSFLLHFI